MIGKFGAYACDDGSSRPFEPDSTVPRMIVAIVLAKRDGWAEIRPAHWASAGAIVTALKAKVAVLQRPRANCEGSAANDQRQEAST